MFPLRVGEPDCVHYLKTGQCLYGASCTFNHPRCGTQKELGATLPQALPQTLPQTLPQALQQVATTVGNDGRDVFPSRPGRQTCAFYMRTGRCKYGWGCRFHHPRAVLECATHSDGRFMHPERENTPVCQYYMRTGRCTSTYLYILHDMSIVCYFFF